MAENGVTVPDRRSPDGRSVAWSGQGTAVEVPLHRSLLTVVIAAVFLTWVATAAPAAGESVRSSDPRGDLFNENIGDIDPTQTDPDALRIRSAHRAKAVVVVVRFLALNPEERHESNVYIDVSPKKAGSDFLAIGLSKATGQQRQRLATFPDQGRVRCPGMSASFDHDDRRLKMKIPRECLDLPRHVSLNTAVYRAVRVSEDYTYRVNGVLRAHELAPSGLEPGFVGDPPTTTTTWSSPRRTRTRPPRARDHAPSGPT